jgi:mannose-6-phosphate isomerase-like protein (cupin superfamily)
VTRLREILKCGAMPIPENFDMTPPVHSPLGLIGIAILAALPLAAQEMETKTGAGSGNVLLTGTEIPYEEIAPGVERALLHGNPAGDGEPFAFRLRVTGTFQMEPHTHPVPEHMTVLSGRLFVGIGEVMDRSRAVEYGPGSYVMINADVPAYMWTQGTTVVQIHGVGPLRTVFVPKRDPLPSPCSGPWHRVPKDERPAGSAGPEPINGPPAKLRTPPVRSRGRRRSSPMSWGGAVAPRARS